MSRSHARRKVMVNIISASVGYARQTLTTLGNWFALTMGLGLITLAAVALAVPWAYQSWWHALDSLDESPLPPLVIDRALQVCSAGFSVVLIVSLARRVVAGAAWSELLRSRFEEVLPLRALVHLVHLILWIAVLASLAAWARSGYALYREYNAHATLHADSLLLTGGLMVGVVGLNRMRKAFRAHFVAPVATAPPRVSVAIEMVGNGIAPSALARLGCERFPNRVGRFWWVDTAGRACLLLALSAFAGVIVWLQWFEREHASPLAMYHSTLQAAIAWVREFSSPTAEWSPFALVLAYFALIVGALCLTRNRHYLLFSFSTQQWIHLAVAVALVAAVAALGGSAETVVVAAVGGLVLWCIRLLRDLTLDRRYSVRRAAKSEIRKELSQHTPLLAAALEDPACRLPEIQVIDIQERITQGAANIAESDPFVTRRFGRYLRVGRVSKQRCATAMMRYMTVDRSVGLSGGWSTFKPLGGPSVPVWDETRFPLDVPAGFVDRNDALQLDADWNVVRSCGPCGGSGRVWETEYYTETEHYTEYVNGHSESRTRQVQRSRQVQRTCSSCGGAGRLEYGQVLYTHWRSLRPSEVHPFVPMPELVEGAEEVCLARTTLTENRCEAAPRLEAVEFRPELLRELESAAESIRAKHATQAPGIVEYLGGRLYRAEYSIWAFHTLQVRFSRFSQRVGWFFGRRPEFYFPRLPFSWSRLGVTLFLPPLFAGALALAVSLAVSLVLSIPTI